MIQSFPVSLTTQLVIAGYLKPPTSLSVSQKAVRGERLQAVEAQSVPIPIQV